jgi:TolB protein
VRIDGTQLRTVVGTRRWSPGGTKLVFSATSGSNAGDLFVVDADGSGRALLLSNGKHKAPAGWSSPDSSKILFTSDRNGGSQIFVMNLDRTHLRDLSGRRRNEFDPSWR